ncbi:hemolysin-III related-domain-containing protein [Mycena amicta]|nr:hemolysin-III related-domain-containing protein [Mycena amicta]
MPSRANRRRAARRRNRNRTSLSTSATATEQRRQMAMAQHSLPIVHSHPSLFTNASSLLARLRSLLSLAAERRQQKEQLFQQHQVHEKQPASQPPSTVVPSVEAALEKSCNGHHLISFQDLPAAWRGTPFVTSGYRFIPLQRFPALLLSMFTLHNEFLNIQTHVITFIYTCYTFYPTKDLGETIVFVAVLFCLAASISGHLMAGCSHQGTMETCGRVDYVGIVWLLCACNASLVFYGYVSTPHLAYPFLFVSFLMALAGSTLPFVSWFNQLEHRRWRLSFFIALEIAAITPVVGIGILYGLEGMKEFLFPFVRSLALSALGIVFYSNHLPERFLNPDGKWARRFDAVGFGSHAIWHVLSVLSIVEWSNALGVVRHSFANRAFL